MSKPNETRSGAEVLIDALKINAVERIYCIPGESYLAALDALYDRSEISVIVCRNEGGAAFMAEAEGKLSGRPGICFVTRGPGATNASGGLHVALQDSTPMILLIGQIARKDLDREAFQEIDYRRMFSEVAKWVAQIDDADSRRHVDRSNHGKRRARGTTGQEQSGGTGYRPRQRIAGQRRTAADHCGWQRLERHEPPAVAAIC